jgi:hypothetical protein
VPKFTLAERQFVKSIVTSASIKRLTDKEIIEEVQKYFSDKEPVSREYLSKVRRSIKKDAFNWYNNLREGKYDYIHEFKERINEVHWMQKKHCEIVDNPKEPTTNKQVSLAELHRLNITLSNYFDVAPDIINNGSSISKTPETKTINTTTTEITV